MEMKYGLPGSGVLAQTVAPNKKCDGCLHHERDRGASGLCLIGYLPLNCGDGSHPRTGYAPVTATGPGKDSPGKNVDLGRPGTGDPGNLGRGVSAAGRDGSGYDLRAETIDLHSMGLEKKHADALKGLVVEALDVAKSGCVMHRDGNVLRGISSSSAPLHLLKCGCVSVDRAGIAKAFRDMLSNRLRERVSLEQVREIVEKAVPTPMAADLRKAKVDHAGIATSSVSTMQPHVDEWRDARHWAGSRKDRLPKVDEAKGRVRAAMDEHVAKLEQEHGLTAADHTKLARHHAAASQEARGPRLYTHAELADSHMRARDRQNDAEADADPTLKAMTPTPVQPSPDAAKKPPGYLPGVNDPKSPVRPPMGISAMKPKAPAVPKPPASPKAPQPPPAKVGKSDAEEEPVEKADSGASRRGKADHVGIASASVAAMQPHVDEWRKVRRGGGDEESARKDVRAKVASHVADLQEKHGLEAKDHAKLARHHAAAAQEARGPHLYTHTELSDAHRNAYDRLNDAESEVDPTLKSDGPDAQPGKKRYANPEHQKMARLAEANGLSHHVDAGGNFFVRDSAGEAFTGAGKAPHTRVRDIHHLKQRLGI